MKLGTVVYDNKIYNLDYMSSEDMQGLLQKIENSKDKNFEQGQRIIKR